MVEIEAPCCGATTVVEATVPDRVRCDACGVEVEVVDPTSDPTALPVAA